MSADMMSVANAGSVNTAAPPPEVVMAAKGHAPEKAEVEKPEVKAAEETVSSEEILKKTEAATEQLNGIMDGLNKGIRFRTYEDTNDVYVEIVDRKTDEVIRSIPCEEVLEHTAKLDDVIGMMLDTTG